MIKGVLFDLDGTLIDSAPSIIRCFEKTFAELFPEVVLTEEEKLHFLGPTLVQTFSNYTDDMDLVQKAFDNYVKHSRSEHDNNMLPAFPNAKETLKKLKEKGYKVGLVTSKKSNMAKRGLENNGLLEYIDLVVGFDHVKNHKPAPDSLLKAANILNLDVSELVYVGDHVNDIIAAKRAGMKSIAVEFSYNIDKLRLENPDYIIKDLEDIIKIVKEK